MIPLVVALAVITLGCGGAERAESDDADAGDVPDARATSTLTTTPPNRCTTCNGDAGDEVNEQ